MSLPLNKYRAFTLVELLVVISIIGILMSLLLPAVNSARESARTLQCKNNLNNIGKACISHSGAHNGFPSGGWEWSYAGDPNRGYRKLQPAGMFYNILPYIERQALHDTPGYRRSMTPVPLYNCPSRRKAMAYPYVHGTKQTYLSGQPGASGSNLTMGRTDYCANGGTSYGTDDCNNGLGDGSDSAWLMEINTIQNSSGPIVKRGNQAPETISEGDGTSNTILAGERYMNPDNYFTGAATDDDQGWDQGYDYDTVRWGGADVTSMSNTNGVVIVNRKDFDTYKTTIANGGSNVWHPMQDRRGLMSVYRWGSSHADSYCAVMCDGSVKGVNYGVDRIVHYQLCSFKDGRALPPEATR